MRLLDAVAEGLSQPDVTEFAIAGGRIPCVMRGGALQGAGIPAPTMPEVLDLLTALGLGDKLAQVGRQPIVLRGYHPDAGELVVHLMRRDQVIQARFTRVTASSPTGDSPQDLVSLLRLARQRNATDLHVVAGRPPLVRIAGSLVTVGTPISPQAVEAMWMPAIPERLSKVLAEEGSCDFALSDPEQGRFRVNVGRQRTGLKASVRLIARQVPTLETLGLPITIERALAHHQGLIVLTGPTGHGKTSTLAALVDRLNAGTTHHIISVEDPVEHLHLRKRAMITQREVGSHTKSFASALKAALREDPDVIVVGDLRDTETVRMALAASETGHLVLGTMNTPSAAKTIDRLIDLFPPGDQPQVRMTLAGGLRLIVSQRLVRGVDGSSVFAAAEMLPGSVALWNLIREGKTYQIPSLQQRGKGLGIVRLDDSLGELARAGKITVDEACALAEAPDELRASLRDVKGP